MPPAIPISSPMTPEKPVFDTFARVISRDRVISAEKAEADKRRAEREQQDESILNIAAHLQKCWQAARYAKEQETEPRLLKCLRQRMGQYDPDVLAEIDKFGGSKVYMLVTNIKCRAFESWVKDIMLPPDEPIFDLDNTPIPKLPQAEEVKIAEVVKTEAVAQMVAQVDAGDPNPITSVTQEMIQDRMDELRDKVLQEKVVRAKRAARYQAKKIEDEFQEGGFYDALSKCINDLSTFPFMILKGPIIRKERSLVWKEDGKGGWIPKIEPVLKRTYERVSPFNGYWSPGSKHIQDGYFFERHQLRRDDLQKMIGVPGFSESAIRAVLDEYGNGGLREWLWIDSAQATAYSRQLEENDPDPPIDALEFWGSVQGDMLREWGMPDKKIPDPQANYGVTAWMIGRWVIMIRINPHPLGRRPYYSTASEKVNDSIPGKSTPELMRDIQLICNAAARAIANNMAIASGPQVEGNMDRIEPGTDVENMWPWKFWPTKSDPTGNSGFALQFFQPNPMTRELMELYKDFLAQASEQTGIPQYVYGSGGGNEAGGTASGLSMLMNAAGKVLKGVIKNIDTDVIKPAVRDHWTHIMLYDKDEYKCGDVSIIARASEHMVIQEALNLRRTEFVNATRNPIDMSIMGRAGRAEMLREQAKALKYAPGEVVPDKEVIEEQDRIAAEQARQQAMMGAPPGGPPGAGPAVPIQGAKLSPSGGIPGEEMRPAA